MAQNPIRKSSKSWSQLKKSLKVQGLFALLYGNILEAGNLYLKTDLPGSQFWNPQRIVNIQETFLKIHAYCSTIYNIQGKESRLINR
jgi:hypothetical protein